MTKRPVRQLDGFYYIKGKKWRELFGSREQVNNGNAYKTKYGLTKADMLMNKWGRIVSKKKYVDSKKNNRLEEYGFGAKKGKFGSVRIRRSMKTRKNRK